MARHVLGMASQPPPVDEMTVRLMMRLGCAAASFMAAMPPMLCPTRCTRSHRRCVCGRRRSGLWQHEKPRRGGSRHDEAASASTGQRSGESTRTSAARDG